LSGVLNQELFFQIGRELLFVWIRVEPLRADVRTTFKDPHYWKNLETVGTHFAEYMKNRSPEAYESFVGRVRGT